VGEGERGASDKEMVLKQLDEGNLLIVFTPIDLASRRTIRSNHVVLFIRRCSRLLSILDIGRDGEEEDRCTASDEPSQDEAY
jgi:hypothetical protein